MEKLSMCRICLVEDVPMYVVVNKNLHELYEKLTDIPFVTEDIRPVLVCFFCCAKLKQCLGLLRKCLKAEELFDQIMDEDYEPINKDELEYFCGLTRSPIELFDIVDKPQTKIIAIKEESEGCEGLDDVIGVKGQNESDDLEPENVDDGCLDVEDIPQHIESDSESEDDVPLMMIKTEVVEEPIVSKNKRRAVETIEEPVAKEPKLDTRRTTPEDTVTAELKNNLRNLKVVLTNIAAERGKYFKEPNKCDQRNLKPVKELLIERTHTLCEKRYICEVCQHSFSRRDHLTKHSRIHTGERPYKCDVCKRSFKEKDYLTKHMRTHTGNKPYKCEICQHSFSAKENLAQHIGLHTGEKPYKCEICQYSFSRKYDLTKHIRTHTGEKPYMCDICDRSFNTNNYLKTHMRTHTGEKPYKCDVCQRSYSSKNSLIIHIRIHTGEKPYKCGVCKRSFSRVTVLRNHSRTHTGDRPYKCDVCSSSFKAKTYLTAHFRIHTGERPYQCNVCQSSFIQKSALTQHIRTHTGEKPYRCEVCHRSFSKRNQLKKHNIRLHSGD